MTVAKRKTLFDDRPVEISELTYIIRQDISALNAQIAQLQQYVRSQQAAAASGKGKAKAEGQVEEHNSNVVMMLQSRLASMGMGFKDVLELRTQNMKASKDRSEQFMHTTTSAAQSSQGMGVAGVSVGTGLILNLDIYRWWTAIRIPSRFGIISIHSRTSTNIFPPATAPRPEIKTSSNSARHARRDTRLDSIWLGRKAKSWGCGLSGAGYEWGWRGEWFGHGHGASWIRLWLSAVAADGTTGTSRTSTFLRDSLPISFRTKDNYIQSRSTAIESIESTIAELGQIFQQLAHMVAEQRETVQRIDADTTDIAA